MEIFLLILCSTFFLIFMVYFTFYIDQDEGIKLSFDEFYKYYCLNPDSWLVGDSYIGKYCKHPEYDMYRCRIKFTSYWKYLIFIRMRKKNIKLKEYNKEYANFLEDIQLDIDKCRKEAEKYARQGTDIINEVINNGSKK